MSLAACIVPSVAVISPIVITYKKFPSVGVQTNILHTIALGIAHLRSPSKTAKLFADAARKGPSHRPGLIALKTDTLGLDVVAGDLFSYRSPPLRDNAPTATPTISKDHRPQRHAFARIGSWGSPNLITVGALQPTLMEP